nr:hypothetical protein [Tanacetum cinerariifolium]
MLAKSFDGFDGCWADSLRERATKADLSGYWSRIAFDGNFLEMVPSYTSIKDPLRRLCHRLITANISGRGKAPEKEEIHGVRESLGEQCAVLDVMSRDFSRFTTWTIGHLSQLLDESGMTYTSYGDYQILYQRCTRQRTDGASSSAAPYTDDQLNP